jgi:hypothetical protein
MNYLFLSAIGESGENEEGTSGGRVSALTIVASKLRAAILRRDMIRNMLEGKPDGLKPGGPTVGTPGRIYNDDAGTVSSKRIYNDDADSVAPKRIYNDDADTAGIAPSKVGSTSAPAPKGSTWKAARPSALTPGKKPAAQPRVQLAAQRRKLLEGKLREAEEQVGYEQLRLQRQGCVLRPDGQIDWSLSMQTVEYDHDLAKQGMTKLTLRQGMLFSGSAPFDTNSMVTQFSGPGYGIYVMSAAGNIHVCSHSVGHRHHSSLLAGKAVAGAGELKCIKGRLVYLTNKSGHYQPKVLHLAQVLHQLLKNGVPPTFMLKVLPDGKVYPTAKSFLSEIAPDNEYELAKLLKYRAFLRDEILGQHKPNPWRTYDPATEKLGVYCANSDRMVPHKEVRQWLKGRGMFAHQETQSGKGR